VCSESACSFGRSGEIVVPLAHLERGVLQHARNEPYLVGGIRRQEGGGGAADIMQARKLAELYPKACADGVIDAARGQRSASI
jgi:hypothetical protein